MRPLLAIALAATASLEAAQAPAPKPRVHALVAAVTAAIAGSELRGKVDVRLLKEVKPGDARK